MLERWDTSLFDLNFIDHDAAMRNSLRAAANITHVQPKLFIANQTGIYSAHSRIDISSWSSNDTKIGTVDGSIAATVHQHSKTYIYSDSGNINVWISSLPDHQQDNKPVSQAVQYKQRLNTESQSGDTNIKVLSPPTHQVLAEVGTRSLSTRKSAPMAVVSLMEGSADGSFLENLASFHQSNSGSVSIAYPSIWSGTIVGLTRYGNISISGDDINFLPEEDHGGLKMLNAHKGVGDRLLVFESWSGKGVLYIGDDD